MSTDETEIRRIAPGMLNAFYPLPGVATGGQPTPADLRALARAGYRTILDIRGPEERRGYDEIHVAREAGLEYINVPVGHGPLADDVFERVLAVLRDESRRPLLFHCASGNRVGLMLIPYLMLDQGRAPREVLQIAVDVGLSSPQLAHLALEYVRRQQPGAPNTDRVA